MFEREGDNYLKRHDAVIFTRFIDDDYFGRKNLLIDTESILWSGPSAGSVCAFFVSWGWILKTETVEADGNRTHVQSHSTSKIIYKHSPLCIPSLFNSGQKRRKTESFTKGIGEEKKKKFPEPSRSMTPVFPYRESGDRWSRPNQ